MDLPLSASERASNSGLSYRLADLRVEVDQGRVWRDQQEIELPRLSYDLLLVLLEAGTATLSVDTLMDRVWPGLVVSPETVSQRVKLLRDALADDAKHPRYIEGVRGRGYRLAVPAQPIQDRRRAMSPVPAAEPGPMATLSPPAAAAGTDTRPRVPLSAWALGFAVLGLLLLGLFVLRPHWGPEAGQGALGPGSIAVLPFTRHAGDDQHTDFPVDGLHDELLTRLTQIPGLRVISRSSVMRYRDGPRNLRQIGAELGVDSVLETAVQQVGDQVRFNVQLIDVRSDQHLWAETFDRQLSVASLLAIQGEIALAISRALELAVAPSGVTKALGETENITAYNEFMAGRTAMAGRLDPEADLHLLKIAADHFGRATEIDPGFARAHASLAQALLRREGIVTGGGIADDRLAAARVSAERAFELAPELPDAHVAMALYHYYGFLDYPQALAHLAIAERGLPGSADVQMIKTWILLRQARIDAAKQSSELALSLDFYNATVLGTRMRVLRAARDFDAILSLAQRVPTSVAGPRVKEWAVAQAALAREGDWAPIYGLVRADPGRAFDSEQLQIFWFARDWSGALAELAAWSVAAEAVNMRGISEMWTGLVLAADGRHDEARTHLMEAERVFSARLRETPGKALARGNLGVVLAGLGRFDEARAALDQADAISPFERDAVTGVLLLEDRAIVQALAGDGAAAAAALDRLLARPGLTTIQHYRLDPLFDGVREHPAFVALVDKYTRPEQASPVAATP